MGLFCFLADFRYFQGQFHHFCESSKPMLKFYKGGGCSEDGLEMPAQQLRGVYNVC